MTDHLSCALFKVEYTNHKVNQIRPQLLGHVDIISISILASYFAIHFHL